MSTISAVRFSLIVAVVAVFGLSVTAPTQLAAQDTASLTGVVADTTGAVLPNVNVKLVDTKTNATRETTTNSVGAYMFSEIPAGPGFKVTFSKQGFSTVTVSDLYLAVATTHAQNVRMEVGQVAVTVEVKGAGSTVTLDTTDASVGQSVDMNMVHEMPIQVRDSPLALLAVQPGVITVGNGGGGNDPNNSRDGATTGARGDQANVTLDGMDVNDFGTQEFGVAIGNAPVESVQEFHVETANPLSAEGRGSGAQVNLVTKSGTNNWHGSAFDYNRVTLLEANNFFNKRTTPITPRTNLIRNQFGGAIGGPVSKDKLFFYFTYNGRRDRTADSEERTVPLDIFRGDGTSPTPGIPQLGYINNNTGCLPTSRETTTPNCITYIPNTAASGTTLQSMDPQNIGAASGLIGQATSFVNGRYPHANDLSFGDGINTGGYRFNVPGLFTENDYVGRIDYNLNSKMKLFGRFTILRTFQPDDVNFAGAEVFPSDPVTHEIIDHPWAVVVGHTWTMSNTKVNQFYFGETRSRLNFPTTFNPAGINNYNGFGPLTVPYFGQSDQGRVQPIPEYRDDFTWTKGNHTWQFGGTFKPIRTTSNITNDYNFVGVGLGGFTPSLGAAFEPANILNASSATSAWDSAFAFTLGRYASVGSQFNAGHNLQLQQQGSVAVRNYRYYETEVYAQDSWRVRPELTLTYGLRYQYYSVPYEVNGLEALPNLNFHEVLDPRIAVGQQGIAGAGALVSYNYGGKGNHGAPSLYGADYKGFAPRLAFAYNPAAKEGFLSRLLGDRKTVIRGGGGIVFDHPTTSTLNFIQDQVNYIFSTAVGTVFGVPLNPGQSLMQDPRFTKFGELPPLNAPSPITVPFVPFQVNGQLVGAAEDQQNYAIDNNLKLPYSITYTLGIQRELPGNFQLDVTYIGRLGRRLIAQSDPAQIVEFVDHTQNGAYPSGHTLSRDFATLSQEVRQDPVGLSAVTPQPFFENQIANGLGQPCTAVFGVNCSFLIAAGLTTQVYRGDLSDTVLGLQGLLPQGVGMPPQFAGEIYVTNQSYSSYNGLLAALHKKLSHGLQFDLNYTYSHSIDNISTITNNVDGFNFAGGIICDSINLNNCRGNSDFDVTHLISFGGIYDLPFGRGKMLFGNAPRWLDEAVGGWQISPLVVWHTGFAFNTLCQCFPFSNFANTSAVFDGDRAAIKNSIHTTSGGQLQLFADPTAAINAFTGPLGFQAGNRNILRGPHYSNFDLSLNKHFPIKEKVTMEFVASAFNAFNHPNFVLPGNGFTDATNPTTFGVITEASAPRQMQLALRLDF